MLASRLIARIEQVFKKKSSLATLFAGPTIEQLTNALQEKEDTGSRKPILPIQATGSKPPFFFLQVPPTLEAIAAAHNESIHAVQPKGPYFLGGWCAGGLVAYEIARQLQEKGQRVDLLVLMDPFFIAARHKVVRGIISRFGDLMRLGQDKQLNWFLRVQHIYRYLRFLRFLRLKDAEHLQTAEQGVFGQRGDKVGLALLGLHSIMPKVEVLRQDNGDIFDWVAAGYAPGLYPGKFTLFWDREDPARRGKWYKGPKTKEVEVHIIPGTHMTVRTEYIHDLAEHLRMCMSQA